MTDTKRCTKCGEVKPLSEFPFCAANKNGAYSWCRGCVSVNNRKWYDKNTIYAKERSRQYHRRNPVSHILSNARSRAKSLNLPFNLTSEDIHIPDVCPVLGIKLEVGGQGGRDNSPSLDRINPSKGYVKGNVWIISNRANRMKQEMSPEGLLEFATKMYDAV